MADTQNVITPDIIVKEGLRQLMHEGVFLDKVYRGYEGQHVDKKAGETISIRRPVKFATSSGPNLSIQPVVEGKTSLTVREQRHVDWEFNTRDLTLSVEDYTERYIKPAMITLAQTVDSDIASEFKNFWHSVGTPGTTPANSEAIGYVNQRMTEQGIPNDGNRSIVLAPAARRKIANASAGLYMTDIAKAAYKNGELGQIESLHTAESANSPYHTTGDFAPSGSAVEIDGAVTAVDYSAVKDTYRQTIHVDGLASGKGFKKGDVINIENCYAVNPVPGLASAGKAVMPYLQDFVVQQDVTEDGLGSGDADLIISPPIITSGPYQTVSAAPANNADVTPKGSANTTYSQNVAFHKNAIALATIPLVMPDGVSFKAQRNYKGLNLRVLKVYDQNTDREVVRVDTMYALDTIYPDLGVRLWG